VSGPPGLARTRDEAHLYMDLHPCDCGCVDTGWAAALAEADGRPARRYYGDCGGCGRHREFLFLLPDRPTLLGPGDVVAFGGPEPSELLDAGEWLWVADLCAADAARLSEGDPAAARSLAIAVAAVEEVLRFVPDGAAEVPADAVWSARGREVWRTERARLLRSRLVAYRDSCRGRPDGPLA
jgi:hypothetical protein